MRKFLIIIALPFGLSACTVQRSVSVDRPQNNQDYTVHYLFKHDGVKVYRFYDSLSDSYVYFTSQGDATAIANDSILQRTATYRVNNDTLNIDFK